MKKVIGLAVAVMFIAGLVMVCPNAFAKEYKIGYVDLAKVFEDYGKTKTAEKALEEKGKAKDADRKKLIDEVRKMKDEQALLSDKAKAEKQPAIDEKVKALQAFDMKVRDELTKERNDLLGGILKDIETVVANYSKEAGYDMILNSRTLLFGSPEYDLTAEITKRLNK